MKRSPEVDKYVADLPPEVSPVFQELREYVLELVANIADIEEVYAYRIPVYKYRGRPIFSIAAFKDHLSFITQENDIAEQFPKELAGYKVSGTTVHLPLDKPVSKSLVKMLVEHRLEAQGAK